MHVSVATIAREASGGAARMLDALRQVSASGLQASVGVSDSSEEFIAEIAQMGHEVISCENGLRGQMEAAFEHAGARGSHVLYFESDKLEFAQTRIVPTIQLYRRRRIDYAVAGRTKRVLHTFPLAQRAIEVAQSQLMAATLGAMGDWIAGPALMPAQHVHTLRDSALYGSDQNGWGVPWYLLGRAWRQGLTIGIIHTATGVTLAAKDEFNPGYRLHQANSILGCFYEGAGIPYDWVDGAPR